MHSGTAVERSLGCCSEQFVVSAEFKLEQSVCKQLKPNNTKQLTNTK
ncbi:MAG TPA: hypothetical protein VJT08_14830 [Terriglobales bacterium]|nr:hypothetical protein [Terriglobales bacterium]